MGAFIDLSIAIALLGAVRSGWRRGFVFYLVDLLGFAGAVVAAVRFHEIPGIFLGDVVGGLVIFVPLILLVAIAGSRMSKAMYRPGLFMLDRVLGAALGAALALIIVVVGSLFAQSAPFGIGRVARTSTIAQRAVEAAAPAIRFVNAELDLDLCGGRLGRVREVCPKR